MLFKTLFVLAMVSVIVGCDDAGSASSTAIAYLTIPNGDDLHPGAIASVEGVDASMTNFALGCADTTSIEDGYAVTYQSDCGDSGVTLIVGPSVYMFELPAEQSEVGTVTYSSVSGVVMSSSCTFSGTTYVSCTASAAPWMDVNNETTEAASSWSTTGGASMIIANYPLLIVGGLDKLQNVPASASASTTTTSSTQPTSGISSSSGDSSSSSSVPRTPGSTIPSSSAPKATATSSSASNPNAVTTLLYGLIAASLLFKRAPVSLTVIATLLRAVHVLAAQSTALIVVPSPVAIFIRPSAASVVAYDGTNTTFLVACRTKYNAVTRTNFDDSSNDCKLQYPHTLTDGPSFFALQATTTDSSITTEYALTCSYQWTTLASCTDYYTVMLADSQTVSVRSETGIFTAGGKALDGLNANFPLTVTAGLEKFSSIAVTTALVTVAPVPATAMPASTQASPTDSGTGVNSMEGVSTATSPPLTSSTMAGKGDVQPLSPAGSSTDTTAATSTSSASDNHVSFAMLATPYCLFFCLWLDGIREFLA